MKKKTLEKICYFYELGKNYPRPVDKSAFTQNGHKADEAFLIFESTGEIVPTCEPERFDAMKTGKWLHGITVATNANGFFDNIVFSKEIKEEFPIWVQNEIFSLAEKIARKKLGFVPLFVKNRKDYSE